MQLVMQGFVSERTCKGMQICIERIFKFFTTSFEKHKNILIRLFSLINYLKYTQLDKKLK